MTIVNRRCILLLSLLLFALPLLAGNDVSSVRYAPLDYFDAADPAIASNGNRFLTLWYADTFLITRSQTYGTLSDASGGSNSPAFMVVPGDSYAMAVIGTREHAAPPRGRPLKEGASYSATLSRPLPWRE